ncbi:hypothetical protein ACWEP5_36285 [Nocardia niigatensis]
MRNFENKERPNASEKVPPKQRSEATVRALGKTAIKSTTTRKK